MTMQLHRIQAKLFLENPEELDMEALIPVFHSWIQEQAFEELLIDVANYAHVPDGPGVMLIAHEADYGIDLTYGRPGLIYTRKRDVPEETAEAIGLALGQVLQAADRLEDETDLTFDRNEIEVTFLDRLQIPNEAASLDLVRESLDSALGASFPDADPHIEWTERDRRMPFGVRALLKPVAA